MQHLRMSKETNSAFLPQAHLDKVSNTNNSCKFSFFYNHHLDNPMLNHLKYFCQCKKQIYRIYIDI